MKIHYVLRGDAARATAGDTVFYEGEPLGEVTGTVKYKDKILLVVETPKPDLFLLLAIGVKVNAYGFLEMLVEKTTPGPGKFLHLKNKIAK